jgi:hypothetical protein
MYSLAVSLVACPFCRELFERKEATECPVCGLALVALEKLPLSHDAVAEGFVPTLPELENQSVWYWKRNRGPLFAVAVVGIVLFFLPWIDMTLPEIRTMSGFELSQRHVQTWCVLVAWLVLGPTVLSRRSIIRMRTARVTTAFLSVIPGLSTVLLALQRQRSPLLQIAYTHTLAFWGTLALSFVGLALSWKFGGKLDDIEVRGSVHVPKSKRSDLH